MYTIMSILVCIIMRGSLYASNSCGKNRSISLSYVKTQLNTLLINQLRFFLIIAPQDISLSASAFEALMDMLAEQEEKKPIKARFPSKCCKIRGNYTPS